MPDGIVPSVNPPPPPMVIVRLTGPVTLCCGLELSVTFTVRFVVPAIGGVPLMVQLLCVNPVGRVPAVIVQVYGAVPPVIPNDPLYGTATEPVGRVGARVSPPPPPPGVIARLTGPLVLSFGFELSVTLTTRFEVPAAVGVPLTVQLLCVSPAGSVPAVMVQV